MKLFTTLISLVIFSCIQPTFAASDSNPVGAQGVQPVAFTWDELRSFVQGCAVQPVSRNESGRLEYLTLVSICPQVLSVHGANAKFRLKKVAYTAALLSSPFADQGDLNTLVIRDLKGNLIAQADHVPAFGDILLALAGGDDSFRQVSVDPAILEE